jgi:2,3-dihydroxybiphenyl 1,2-dioxygenase
LENAGVNLERGGRDDAAERGVAEIVRLNDPSGNHLEVFYGACTEEVNEFRSPTGVCFVTGEQGMGHITLHVSRYAETVDFYRGLLGFGVSDFMEGPPLRATFLGCNARHHSLAVLDTQQDAAHHFMVEVDTLNAVGQAYDRCLDGAAPLVMTLGRHWNDHMTSFYSQSPSGFAVEFGWGGRTVDRDTWTTIQGMGEMSFWGHRPVTIP